MKLIIRLLLSALFVVGMAATSYANGREGWETDVDTALKLAKQQKKAVMLEFTGSDWCPPCKMMSKKVFSKEEFVKEASEHYILVHLDYPKGDKALAEKNQPWLEKYNVEGYPTIVLLDSEGVEFSRFIASKYPEIQLFLDHLITTFENKDLD